MSNKTKAILAILIWALLGGAIPSITKIGLVKIAPFTFSFLRFVIASIAILPFFIRERPKLNRNFLILTILSILPVLNVAFFITGLNLTSASVSQMLYGGVPIMTGILSYLILHQKISRKKWIYILIGLMGVIEVVALPLLEKNSLVAGDLKGNLLIIFAVIIWSIYGIFSKRMQRNFSPSVITSVFIFLATIFFFFLSLSEIINNTNLLSELNSSVFFTFLYVGLLGTVGGYLLNQYAIKIGGPLIASFAFYLSPIFGYGFSYLLLGEKLTTGLIVGTILVFISIALTTYSK